MSRPIASLRRSPIQLRTGLKHLAAAFAVVAVASGTASATLTFSYTGPAKTGATPEGSGPYATATLMDFTRTVNGISYHGVLFTIDNSLNGANEFLTEIAFNYQEPPDEDSLRADFVSGNEFTTSSFGGGTLNGFGSAGTFSLGYDYPTSNDPGSDRFVGGDQSKVFVYSLDVDDPIETSNFNIANDDGFYSVIHVQGITASPGSGKLASGPPTAMPEPSTIVMAIAGLVPLGVIGRRRLRSRPEVVS